MQGFASLIAYLDHLRRFAILIQKFLENTTNWVVQSTKDIRIYVLQDKAGSFI